MNILLTGATGFTGRHFMALARAAGHTVQPLCGDLTNLQELTAAIETALTPLTLNAQPWAVVHLAALSFVGHQDTLEFYRVNTLGTENLLSALSQQINKSQNKNRLSPPIGILLASSANIYGNCNCPQSPIAENQPPAPVNHYAASKLAMEHIALTYTDKLPLLIARPFNYTGPGQARQFVIPKIIEHFAHKKAVIELGNLYVEREYNDVNFICQSYLHLLQYGQNKENEIIYNICTGITYSLYEIIRQCEKITGHTIEVQVNSAFIRVNEITRLCGDPTRLQKIWQRAQVSWPQAATSLEGMIQKMLNEY